MQKKRFLNLFITSPDHHKLLKPSRPAPSMPKKIVTYVREEKQEEHEPMLDTDIESLLEEPVDED